MHPSLNFVPPNAHSQFITASLTSKRPTHSHIFACLDSPHRHSTSLSPTHHPTPRASLPNPSSPQPDRSKPATEHSDRSLPRQPHPDSNGIPVNHTVDDSTTQQIPPPSSPATSADAVIPITLGPLSFSIPPRWLLYSVPFMWGSFGPSVRLLFSEQPHQDPSIFNTERLLLSTLVYVPILLAELQAFLTRPQNQPSDPDENPFAFFPAGIELGVYVFLANVAQVIGLQQTSASRAAFLVQLQTVIVPVLSGIFGIDNISPKTWISSAVAVAGVALLSSDKSHGTVASLTGDSLEILSALFFSTYIIRLGNYCNRLPSNPLVATKIATQAVLSIGWAFLAELGNLFSHAPTHVSSESTAVPWTLSAVAVNIGVVAWTGLMTSAIAGWAQTKGQKGVPASEAVVIFATQPLWASAIAALVLGESFGPLGFAGGSLIVGATLLSSKNTKEPDKDT